MDSINQFGTYQIMHMAVVEEVKWGLKVLPRRYVRRIPHFHDITWELVPDHEITASVIPLPVPTLLGGRFEWVYRVGSPYLRSATTDDMRITVMHELAHIVTPYNQHGHEWRQVFARLLRGFNDEARFYAKYDDLEDFWYPDE